MRTRATTLVGIINKALNSSACSLRRSEGSELDLIYSPKVAEEYSLLKIHEATGRIQVVDYAAERRELVDRIIDIASTRGYELREKQQPVVAEHSAKKTWDEAVQAQVAPKQMARTNETAVKKRRRARSPAPYDTLNPPEEGQTGPPQEAPAIQAEPASYVPKELKAKGLLSTLVDTQPASLKTLYSLGSFGEAINPILRPGEQLAGTIDHSTDVMTIYYLRPRKGIQSPIATVHGNNAIILGRGTLLAQGVRAKVLERTREFFRDYEEATVPDEVRTRVFG